MKRMNCWAVKACGRQPGGENTEAHGVCPAALLNEFDGVNRGERAGRFCWAVAGSLCGGQVQGTYAKKLMNCINCEFLKRVQEEEGGDFTLTPRDAQSKLGRKA